MQSCSFANLNLLLFLTFSLPLLSWLRKLPIVQLGFISETAKSGYIHTNMDIFEIASFFHKSAFRSHETRTSGHQYRIALKPLSKKTEDPIHTNGDKKYSVSKMSRFM